MLKEYIEILVQREQKFIEALKTRLDIYLSLSEEHKKIAEELDVLRENSISTTPMSSFFKTKKFKEYEAAQRKQEELEARKKAIEEKIAKVMEEEKIQFLKDLHNLNAIIYKIKQKIEASQKKLDAYRSAQTFSDVGESPEGIFKILYGSSIEKGGSFSIDESELIQLQKLVGGKSHLDSDYRNIGIKGLWLVHRTNFIPEDSTIRPISSETRKRLPQAMKNLAFEGNHVDVLSYEYRSTVHFSVNHAIIGHGYGNWQGMKFTILAPLDELLKNNRGIEQKIGSISIEDFYFRETDICLPRGTVIVCDEKDVKQLKKHCPGVVIIAVTNDKSYAGEERMPADEMVKTFLRTLDYDPNLHRGGEDEQLYKNMPNLRGKKSRSHFYSLDSTIENQFFKSDYYVTVLSAIGALSTKFPDCKERLLQAMVKCMSGEKADSHDEQWLEVLKDWAPVAVTRELPSGYSQKEFDNPLLDISEKNKTITIKTFDYFLQVLEERGHQPTKEDIAFFKDAFDQGIDNHSKRKLEKIATRLMEIGVDIYKEDERKMHEGQSKNQVEME